MLMKDADLGNYKNRNKLKIWSYFKDVKTTFLVITNQSFKHRKVMKTVLLALGEHGTNTSTKFYFLFSNLDISLTVLDGPSVLVSYPIITSENNVTN